MKILVMNLKPETGKKFWKNWVGIGYIADEKLLHLLAGGFWRVGTEMIGA